MINDYPYGRTLRCRRRVWLEGHPKHGYRFVSQTEHPVKKAWNKPHSSTYTDIAAALYIDSETGHVEWTGISVYSEAKDALEFVQAFGVHFEGAKRLGSWATHKANLAHEFATGQAFITVNGTKQDRSETERTNDHKESDTWLQVVQLIREGLASYSVE
jgi:hypothetical protein